MIAQGHPYRLCSLCELSISQYHKSSILSMQDFHACQGSVHEDERLAVLHVALHFVGHNAAQRVETLPHVRGIGIQVERIRFTQAEHRH